MGIDTRRPTVVFVLPWVRHYNAAFLEMLRQRLDRVGVNMDLIYGQPAGVNAGRGDTASPEWASRVNHRDLGVGPLRFTWQPYVEKIRQADLVIAQQASKLLLNYVMVGRQYFGGPRVAFWGHGRNFQASSLTGKGAEFAKRFLTRRVHWFFAYTNMSAQVLIEDGYPSDRITVVKNSIDTRSLSEARDRVTAADVRALREELGLVGKRVGIFCGAMYAEKRLDFLLAAAHEIRAQVEGFELIFVGDGVDRPRVDKATNSHDWIHAVGPQFGDNLARYFALSSVFLLPGLVGLTILDSFVFHTPIVTTAEAMHSPEIEYLEDGVNGLVVQDASVAKYAKAVADVLLDIELRQRLAAGCARSAYDYSMEEMADRFAAGVVSALSRRQGSRS